MTTLSPQDPLERHNLRLEALERKSERHDHIHRNILERLATIQETAARQDDELAATNTLVTNLMHRTYGEDTDKMMSVRMKRLESELDQMAFYLLGGISATVQQPIPQRLKAMEDQLEALGPWIKGLYDEVKSSNEVAS